MDALIIIAIAVAAAVVAGITAHLITKSNFSRRIAAVTADKKAVSEQLAEAQGNISRLTGDINVRDIRIQGLEKDVQYKSQEAENAKTNFDERLTQSEEQHQRHLADVKAEDGAALKSNESVELYLTVTRYTGIGNINENQPSFFKRFKDGIELGSTGGTYPPEAGFVAVTGDTFAIFKAFGEYDYRYLYGDDMMLTGNFRINTDNIDDFDKKTLDDIRCFFESLGIENPLILQDK